MAISITGGRITPSGWFGRRRDERLDETLAADLAWQWRQAAEGAGAGRQGASAAGIPFTSVPTVVGVDLADPITLLVELLPGQLPVDIAAESRRLAAAMGVAAVRIRPAGHDRVQVTLLDQDPLSSVVPAVPPVRSALDPVVLGVGEDGQPLTLDLAKAAHLIIQGATGSGKSVGLYSLLSQLTEAPDVRVTGVDPTGLLLRPWLGRSTDVPPPATGTRHPVAYLATLGELVKLMDRRISAIPAGRDQVTLGTACPAVLCVLEEYPGILRVLDTEDPKLGKTFRALVGRLLAEGRKAGIRVLLVAQRADASVIGGFERGQASHRLSFRVDSVDACRMLHPNATVDTAAEHSAAPTGVALLSAPGLPLTRVRAPFLDYAAYCAAVAGHCGRAA